MSARKNKSAIFTIYRGYKTYAHDWTNLTVLKSFRFIFQSLREMSEKGQIVLPFVYF